jgi:hypothetical protein
MVQELSVTYQTVRAGFFAYARVILQLLSLTQKQGTRKILEFYFSAQSLLNITFIVTILKSFNVNFIIFQEIE